MSGEAKPRLIVTVGPVPERKGQWLGVQNGVTWTPLAKFRSDQAAKDFLALMDLPTAQGDRLTIGGKTYEVEEYEWVDYAETSSNYSVWVKRDDAE